MENKMRQTLNEIYFGKTKDVVNDLRCEIYIIACFYLITSYLVKMYARSTSYGGIS